MPSPFPGFPPEALQFFRGLARNNKREWFLSRKPLFEERVKEPMRQLVDALNLALHDFAPEYEAAPDKAIFRIYRDIRFSKDKKPYKEQIAATFHWHGSMSHGQGGYYVDRKSTRLNSSHSQISYAVFCLKKKKCTHCSRRPPFFRGGLALLLVFG